MCGLIDQHIYKYIFRYVCRSHTKHNSSIYPIHIEQEACLMLNGSVMRVKHDGWKYGAQWLRRTGVRKHRLWRINYKFINTCTACIQHIHTAATRSVCTPFTVDLCQQIAKIRCLLWVLTHCKMCSTIKIDYISWLLLSLCARCVCDMWQKARTHTRREWMNWSNNNKKWQTVEMAGIYTYAITNLCTLKIESIYL